MLLLKQSTAVDVVLGPFVDDTDGKTPETGLTISQADCQLSKNAGAVAQKNDATAASHLGGGHYKVPLNATDTNTLGWLRLYVNESGALPAWLDFMVMPANVWDSLFGADLLQVDVTQIVGAAVSTSTAQLGVNAVQAGGTAWGSGAITAGAIADNAIDAGALATSAVDKVVDAVWDEPIAGHLTVLTTGALLEDAGSDWTEAIADAVWDEALGDHDAAGSTGEALGDAGGGSSPSSIADAVWDEALAGHVAAGSAGLALGYARDGSMIYGSTTAANNAKKAFNGEAYNASGLTVGAATAVTNTVNANIVNLNGSATDFDKLLALFQVVIVGTVTAGTNTTTVVTAAGLGASADFYKDKTFIARTGANAGQGGKLVTDYDGATKRLTIEALTAAMAVGDKFVLVG